MDYSKYGMRSCRHECTLNTLEKRWREKLNGYLCRTTEDIGPDLLKSRLIDKGILPLVSKLRMDGFQTIGSCEGGIGSCSGGPYVQLLPDIGATPYQTFLRLEKCIKELNVEFRLALEVSHNSQGYIDCDGIPLLLLRFNQFDLPPLHEGEFSHKQYKLKDTTPTKD